MVDPLLLQLLQPLTTLLVINAYPLVVWIQPLLMEKGEKGKNTYGELGRSKMGKTCGKYGGGKTEMYTKNK